MDGKWYMEKPKYVKAMEWNGDSFESLVAFCGKHAVVEAAPYDGSWAAVVMDVCERDILVTLWKGDYIVEYGEGKFKAVSKEEFKRGYEEIDYAF